MHLRVRQAGATIVAMAATSALLALPAHSAVAASGNSQQSTGCTASLGAWENGPHTIGAPDGSSRTFTVYAPDGATRSRTTGAALPLIISPHHLYGDAQAAANVSSFTANADKRGYIVVYPQAQAGRGGVWDLSPNGVDASFIVHLTREVQSRYCVDNTRVAVAGFSQGAMMSTLLWCTHPGLYSGGAGAMSGVIDPRKLGASCRAGSSPLYVLHGDTDTVLRIDGSQDEGVSAAIGEQSASNVSRKQTTESLLHSRCDKSPQEADGQVNGQASATWTCHGQNIGEFVSVSGLGHAWPVWATDWILDRLLGQHYLP